MSKYFQSFYESKSWRLTRKSYFNDANGICERCGGVGEIVHHVEYITNKTINDINITLNKDNLELLCRQCHAKEHEGVSSTADGVRFNEQGEIVCD